jgi:hypothetical protein
VVAWLCRTCDTRLPADWAVREERPVSGAADYWPLFVAAFAAGVFCGVIFEIIHG